MSSSINKGVNLAYVFPIVILCYTFSLLWGWIPRTHSLITLLIGLAVGVVVSYRYFTRIPMFYFLLYVVVLALNVMANDHRYNSFASVFYEVIYLLLPSLMVFGLMNSDNDKCATITIKAILWMLIINAIGTFFVDTMFPGSIRAINAETRLTGNSSTAMYFYRFGLANYFLPHALPTIIPVLVMGIKYCDDRKKRWLLTVVLVACLLLVYFSGATTALLLAVVALLVAVFSSSKGGIRQIILIVVISLILIPVFSNDELMLSVLQQLDDIVNHEGYFHSKILDFQDLIMYGETTGDVEARENLYTITINAIIGSPLFGVNTVIGGHSNLLDQWGYLGIVGWLPWLLFIISQVRMSGRKLQSSSKIFYVEGVLMAFLMLAIKSMAGWESWLFLFTVLPLLTRYCENDSKNPPVFSDQGT